MKTKNTTHRNETKGQRLRRVSNDIEFGKAKLVTARGELIATSPAIAARLSKILEDLRTVEAMLLIHTATAEAQDADCDVIVMPADGERLAFTGDGQPYRPRFGDTARGEL